MRGQDSLLLGIPKLDVQEILKQLLSMPVEGLPAGKKRCDNLLEPMQKKNTRLNILSWLPCWDFSIHVTIVDTYDLLELHNNMLSLYKMIIAK